MDFLQSFSTNGGMSADALAPKGRKPYPFPLERLEEDIANAYEQVQMIFNKLEAARTNPVNHTKARKKRIDSLKYKTKTCLMLLKEISSQSSELWF